ncbi:MAG TPA: toll/interleukin-1 receptor domain-containing protein [Steroidobacteraceae bacterium]|nr:toll/interleukin-1 receptor domain-containing protein [Steroidobacteraceae bacterium]
MAASVFLSYASEDRQAARSIGDALTSFGLDVWLDESELGGGDAWDQKIRRQIRECDYFMPVVSARTEARPEGYFRREWRLAVERTLDMADDHLFLLPVAIDETDQAHARVPEKFLQVQWLKVPQGRATPALEALCRRIAAGDLSASPSPRKAPAPAARSPAAGLASPYPPFPRELPGARLRFWAQVLGWSLRCAWISFQRLPRWIRIVVYVWAVFFLVSHGCAPRHHESRDVSVADMKKLAAIADQYQGASDPANVARLGVQIAREFSGRQAGAAQDEAILAIPFAAPAADPSAQKLADTAFAETCGRLAMRRDRRLDLDKDSGASTDAKAALERARAARAAYVVYGFVERQTSAPVLSVSIADVADGSLVWSRSYSATGADASKIGAEVSSKVPLEDAD